MSAVYRIGMITGWLMLGAAVFIDILELILTAFAVGVVADWLTWIVSWIMFPIWFAIKGASFTKDKKLMGRAIIGMAIGLIPIVNALPELTMIIWMNIKVTRKEDKEKQAKIDFQNQSIKMKRLETQRARREIRMARVATRRAV